MNILDLIGRNENLFEHDINEFNDELNQIVSNSRFLIIGGAGSIGQAVTIEIFKRQPETLHVVDISENNLVELVRNIRSSLGYIKGDFRTFAIDCGGAEYEKLVKNNDSYDYILNLSALKHVRSERDPYTLMRLIDVNIFNTIKTLNLSSHRNLKKYFCVSTDKATNPVNLMGASKRVMEMFLMKESESIPFSTARFANVAFSDGSLLHGFNQRFSKQQPIAAPNDVKRYFITPQESGELCLMSCLMGHNRDIFFPKLSEELDLITFSKIAEKYIYSMGYEPYLCSSEEEARSKCNELISKKHWPCYFFKSDTTGEKDFEEFYTKNEDLDLSTFSSIGVIKNKINYDQELLELFEKRILKIRNKDIWDKDEIIELFNLVISNFNHKSTGKYLDDKM